MRIPEDLLGSPVLLLCAYRRGAQADIDQWAAFAGREAPHLPVYELPIIDALVWRPLRGLIDGGMRGGVPRAQWSHVVTVYGDGAEARAFIGDGGGDSAQVVLLDAAGRVAFHDAGGFSESSARGLVTALAATTGGS